MRASGSDIRAEVKTRGEMIYAVSANGEETVLTLGSARFQPALLQETKNAPKQMPVD